MDENSTLQTPAPQGTDPQTAGTNPAAPQTPPAAAPPQQAPAPAAQPQLDRSGDPGGQIAEQPMAAMPVPVRPMRRGGLAGIVDELRDALAGTSTAQIYTDEKGNQYQINPPMTHGQQWAKIASEGIRGAAAGLVAGRGPNGHGRALAAGLQVADQQQAQEKSDLEQQRQQGMQDTLNRFNLIKLQHDTAANEFALQRMQVNAQQQDITFAEGQIQREHELHSADLGTYSDPADLARVQQQIPDFWKQVYAGNIRQIPQMGADGSRQGIHLFMRTPGIGDQVVPAGSKVLQFVPGQKPTDPPTLAWRTLSGRSTNDQVDAYNASAWKQYQEYFKNDAEIKNKQADTGFKQADADLKTEEKKNQPGIRAKNAAEAGKANAEAGKANAEAAAARLTGGAEDSPLVDEIGQGKMAVGRMSYLLSRNQSLAEAVARKYPDFDSSKVEGYAGTYNDFTHGNTANAINAGGTAMRHLHELLQLNTAKSHIPHTADWTRYMNKADTVSTELARFYGDETIPGIRSIKATLTSTLPGNRGAAISTQVTSMGDKMDSYEHQWRNAAPSPRYQAPMPGIDEKAKEARAALDPEYRKRYTAELQGNPQPPPQQAAPQAAPQTHVFSKSAWQKANPQGDVNQAVAAAQQQQYQVVD